MKKVLTLDELIESVGVWADEKGITGEDNFFNQWEKVKEEFNEMSEEVALLGIGHGNIKDLKLETGDLIVTLIVLLRSSKLSLHECLELAYYKIKDRKGKTIDGLFVKEEDLKQ